MTDSGDGEDRDERLLPPPWLPPPASHGPDPAFAFDGTTAHHVEPPPAAPHRPPTRFEAAGVHPQAGQPLAGDALAHPAAQHHQAIPQPEAVQHHLTSELSGAHQQSTPLPGAAERQSYPELSGQHQQDTPLEGRRLARAGREVGRTRYFVAAGAALVAASAAVVIVAARRSDSPNRVVATAPTHAIAVAPTTTARATPVGASAPTTSPATAPATAPATVPATAPDTSAATPGSAADTAVASTEAAPTTLAAATTVAPGPPVPDPACATESTLKSARGVVVAQLMIVNNTNLTLQAIWLDYTGKRVSYGTVAPFSTRTQPTWLTHPWIVASEQGACYRLIVMTSVNQTVTVDPGPG